MHTVAKSYGFGPFVLIPERRVLLQDDAPVRLGSRALDILMVLVERSGDIVTKAELLERVWPDTVVDDSNLKVNLASLRRALGETASVTRYIATVVGRGYQFVAPVQSVVADAPVTTAPSAHNLPTATTSVFGRQTAIEGLHRDLTEARLVSIVGPGGIGKTTVALAVAERMVRTVRDGVWLIDLALLQDPALVPNAIATALGLAEHSPNMLETVCEYLRDREMLLVLDSCEHLIESAAGCASRILASARGVRVLATSREPLEVKGERVRRLVGLDAPATKALTAAEAMAFPAVQLFVERASDRLESFRLSDGDAPIVAEICRSLDGLALAIELAAARIDVFGVVGLQHQLADRFGLLAGRRAGPERHRTLTATLDWSYGLLVAEESAVLRAVAVFMGGFDVDGAAAVGSVGRNRTAQLLAQLAAKSLVSTTVDGDGIAYRLLESTRAYCLERLRESGEDAAVRARHAEHVCAVLERATSEWATRPSVEWGEAYGRVLDDLRAALAVADRELRVRLTVAGLSLWNHLSLTRESRDHAARAVAELGSAGTAAEMRLQLMLAATTMATRGPMPEVESGLRRALEVAEQIGDVDHRLRTLRMLATYQVFVGEHDAALATLATFAAVAAEDVSAAVAGETQHAMAEIFVGKAHDARRRMERMQRDTSDAGFARFLLDREVDVGNVLATAQWLTGSPETAMRTAAETVERAIAVNHYLSLSNALAIAALPVHFWSGAYDECSRYLAMLEDVIRQHGIAMWSPIAVFYRGALALVRGGDGVDDIKRALDEFHAIRHFVRMPFYLGVLAVAYAKRGELELARTTVQKALAQAHAQNERWCVPEIMRIQASIFTEQAEPLLVDAMARANEMGALGCRLRSANDLAHLWQPTRADDARELLLPIYRAFTEGFATRDLRVAAELLGTTALTGGEAR